MSDGWRGDRNMEARVIRAAVAKMENRRLIVKSLDDGGFHIDARGLLSDKTILRRSMRLSREAAMNLVAMICEMSADVSSEEAGDAEDV